MSQSIDLEKADDAIALAKAQANFAVEAKERELKESRAMYEQQIAALKEKLKDSDSKAVHQAALVDIRTDANTKTPEEFFEAKVISAFTIHFR